MPNALLIIVLIANALWFTAAFRFFWLKAFDAAKLLVARQERSSPLFNTIANALPFLGGMNLALAGLAVLIIAFQKDFAEPIHIFVYSFVFAMAHASQFFGNLPVALTEWRSGHSIWPVLRGTMLFIFTVDLVLAAVNALISGAALSLHLAS